MKQLRQSLNEHWQLAALALLISSGGNYTVDSLMGKSQTQDHEERIVALETSVAGIDAKLDKILVNQQMEAIAYRYKTRDRWTATMQAEFQDIWYEVVRDLHPEAIEKESIPNIYNIQRKYPEGIETP